VTHIGLDGNRLVAGSAALFAGPAVDVALGFEPEWIVGVADGAGGSVWVAVSAGGEVEGHRLRPDGSSIPLELNVEVLPPGAPPLVRLQGGDVQLVTYPDIAPLTHPAPLANGERYAYLTTAGTLKIVTAGGETVDEVNVNALPDARLMVDEADRLLVLTGPTDSYTHDVLGDSIEAAGVTLFETQPMLREVTTIPARQGHVIEGIAPLWADVTGDGVREIIVTEADQAAGAEIRVYSEDGVLVAEGPAVGQGFRWRHQLAVWQAEGEPVLAEVLTPHLGGVVGVYRVEGEQLVFEAQQRGYTSHVIGSRNLDLAAAGDFTGEAGVNLLLPTQDRTALGVLGYGEGGITVEKTLELPARLSSNLHAHANGQLWVGAGLENAILRVWGPTP
jgi:hypothetical protein